MFLLACFVCPVCCQAHDQVGAAFISWIEGMGRGFGRGFREDSPVSRCS